MHNNSQYKPNDPPTPSQERTQQALNKLFKAPPPADHTAAAAEFLATVEADWPNPTALHHATFRHPMILGSSNMSRMSLYDIIADYIIQGDADRPNVRERDAEHPAYTMRYLAELDKRHQARAEYLYDVDDDADDEDAGGVPYGHISADKAAYTLAERAPSDTITADDLLGAINDLQGAQTANARRLAPLYDVPVEVMRDRIRKLTPDNIKRCKRCSVSFYARDKRMEYCGGVRYRVVGWERGTPIYERAKSSECKAAAENESTQKTRTKIGRDRVTGTHVLIEGHNGPLF